MRGWKHFVFRSTIVWQELRNYLPRVKLLNSILLINQVLPAWQKPKKYVHRIGKDEEPGGFDLPHLHAPKAPTTAIDIVKQNMHSRTEAKRISNPMKNRSLFPLGFDTVSRQMPWINAKLQAILFTRPSLKWRRTIRGKSKKKKEINHYSSLTGFKLSRSRVRRHICGRGSNLWSRISL